LKYKKITEATDSKWKFNPVEKLHKLIENPYYSTNPNILKALDHSHCRFCWSQSVYETTYAWTIIELEVWKWLQTKVPKPIKILDWWEIEKVTCWACKKDLTTINISWDYKPKENNANQFAEFMCPSCKWNVFKEEWYKKAKVKVEYAKFMRVFDIDNKAEYKNSLLEIWWIKEIFCQNEGCHWAKYI
jgi:hypothetical protein